MKVKDSFIPYLLLLVGLLAVIYYIDGLAEEWSDEPIVIQVEQTELDEDQNLWQFENQVKITTRIDLKNDSLYTKATDFYRNKKWMKSEDVFLELLRNYPNEPVIFNYLGLLQNKQLKYLKGNSYFEKAINEDKKYVPAYINSGIYYANINNYKVAFDNYQLVIDLERNNPTPYLNMGILYCKLSNWNKAKKNLTQAVKLASGKTKAKALTYLGIAQVRLQEPEASRSFEEAILIKPNYLFARTHLALLADEPEAKINALKKVLQLNEKYAPAYFYLANTYSDLGDLLETEKYLKKALEVNPNDNDLATLLGDFYIRNDFIETAERYFVEFLNETETPDKYFYEAKIATRKGKYSEAIEAYNKAISLSNEVYAEAYLNLGIIYKRLNKIDLAIKNYQLATENRESYSSAHYNMALAFDKKKNIKEALKQYDIVLEINPNHFKTHYNLGVLYSENKELSKSIKHLKKAIEINNSYLKAYYNLAIVYSKTEQYKLSEQTYNSLLDKYPGSSKAWYNLGIVYREQKKKDKSILAYQKAIELDPNYVAAWKNIASVFASKGELQQAINNYLQAIDLDQSDPELRFNIALQFEKLSDYKSGINHLKKGIELNPKYIKAYAKIKEFYVKEKDEKGRLLLQEKYFTNFPNIDSLYNLARAMHKEKMYKPALRNYEKAIKLGKKNDWVYYWIANTFDDMGDKDAAIQGYNKTLEINKKHKFSHYRLYRLLKKEKNNDYLKHRDYLVKTYPDFASDKNIK